MAYKKRRTLIDNKGESANRSDRGVMDSVGSAIGSAAAKGAATGAAGATGAKAGGRKIGSAAAKGAAIGSAGAKAGARKIGSAARGAGMAMGKAITRPMRKEQEFRQKQEEYWKKNHDPRYKD